MSHYHLIRYPDDDNPPEIFPDVYSALGYAAEILREAADRHMEFVSYVADKVDVAARNRSESRVDPGEMEDALRDYVQAETYENLAANASTRRDNHEQARKDRAPLFRDDDTDDNDPESALFKSAEWAVDEINFKSDVNIWSCEAETGEVDDPMSGEYGMVYCAADLAEG